MPIKHEETPLYFACASLLRVLMHQFVLTGETREERAAIQADIFSQTMRDLGKANTDETTLKSAEEIVAAIFGASTAGKTKN